MSVYYKLALLLVRDLGLDQALQLIRNAWDEETYKTPADLPDDLKLEELELSVRTSNCMKDAGVTTVGEVRRMSDANLKAIKHFGARSLRELRQATEE